MIVHPYRDYHRRCGACAIAFRDLDFGSCCGCGDDAHYARVIDLDDRPFSRQRRQPSSQSEFLPENYYRPPCRHQTRELADSSAIKQAFVFTSFASRADYKNDSVGTKSSIWMLQVNLSRKYSKTIMHLKVLSSSTGSQTEGLCASESGGPSTLATRKQQLAERRRGYASPASAKHDVVRHWPRTDSYCAASHSGSSQSAVGLSAHRAAPAAVLCVLSPSLYFCLPDRAHTGPIAISSS